MKIKEKSFFIVSKGFEDFGRDTPYDSPGCDVFRNDGSGGDDSSVADRDAGKNRSVSSDPDLVSYPDRISCHIGAVVRDLLRLRHISIVESSDLIERNLVKLVVEVNVGCACDDEKFLVVATEFLESVLSEIS